MDIESELSAITAVYEEEIAYHNNEKEEDTIIVMFKAEPRLDFINGKLFVRAEIEIRLKATTYPNQSPIINIKTEKGLGRQRCQILLNNINAFLNENNNEFILYELCEFIRDQLTEMNSPNGNCTICLNSFCDKDDKCANLNLTKLPCFHVFHNECYVVWCQYQQRELKKKASEMIEKVGEVEAARLMDNLPPRKNNIFMLNCPICRTPIPEDLLIFNNESDLESSYEIWRQKNIKQENISISDILTHEELQKLKSDETWRNAILKRQIENDCTYYTRNTTIILPPLEQGEEDVEEEE